MNANNLTNYLRDHLAGSVAGLELLDHLITRFKDTDAVVPLTGLKTEVEADQALLKGLLKRLAADEGTLKKAGAWMVERVAVSRMQAATDELGTLEALEMMVLGIEGKLRLWRALEVVDLGLNLPELEIKAQAQIVKVEALRMLAARRALA